MNQLTHLRPSFYFESKISITECWMLVVEQEKIENVFTKNKKWEDHFNLDHVFLCTNVVKMAPK